MLSALQHNKTLCKLELAGNNIPNDVYKAFGLYFEAARGCKPGRSCVVIIQAPHPLD